jgi:SWIM zinc finger
MLPKYSLDKIKFGTDSATFERALGLYESGKVTKFKTNVGGFSAIVLGSKPYRVFLDDTHFNRGTCECYLGQSNTLCKHMVAVALRAVMKGKPLNDHDKQRIDIPQCSRKLGTLSEIKLAKIKTKISGALRYIKSYNGPSHTWFAYQDSLSEGCGRLSAIISDLPVSPQTAKLLVDLLLRMERKLMTAVDDSDGTVGGCMQTIVEVLQEYGRLDPSCIREFGVLKNTGNTSFGWEEPLLKIFRAAKP